MEGEGESPRNTGEVMRFHPVLLFHPIQDHDVVVEIHFAHPPTPMGSVVGAFITLEVQECHGRLGCHQVCRKEEQWRPGVVDSLNHSLPHSFPPNPKPIRHAYSSPHDCGDSFVVGPLT